MQLQEHSMGQRVAHVDSIRAVAVLLMVMVHSAATWGPSSNTQSSALVYVVSGLGGLAAPLFVTIFGWGCFHSTATANQRYIRAAFLILAQIVVNLSAPHLFDPLTPGVLTLFAILTLTQPLWVKPFQIDSDKGNSILWVWIFAILVSVFLLSNLQGSSQWSDRVEVSSIIVLFKHLILTGTYPLFPWIIFAGFGSWIASKQEKERTFPIDKKSILSIIAGLLFCISTLVYSKQNGLEWASPSGDSILTFFPSNAPFLIAALTGVSLLWILIQATNLVMLNPLGKISLSVYLIHFIPIGLFYNIDNTNDWSLSISMVVVLAYTLLWIPISHLWQKYAPKSNFEHLLRVLSKKN